MSRVNPLSLHKHITAFSSVRNTNCGFHLDSRQPHILSYETDFYTFDIHDFSETGNSWMRKTVFLVFAVSKCYPFCS